ncbi:MAG: tetratricopeptide repeat protein [Candidatus Solibacter usitatus]|nr:tetratricopeptide repeat protein [Candidatus Solibacter usitatus]
MQRLARQFRLLVGLYYRPSAAMGEIIDEGSLIFGAICVIAISGVLSFTPGPFGFFTWLITLAVFFVPAGILHAVLFEPVGGFSVVFRRDYGSFLTCALFGWSASHLPLVPLWFYGIFHPFALLGAGTALFAGVMIFAFRTLYSASWLKSILMTLLSLIATAVCLFLYFRFGGVLRFVASPFILYYLWLAFSGDVGQLSQAFRFRQNFRRLMDAATLNPHDAEPHYQLGLIHQQRRQYGPAIAEFRRAIEIDKTEVDAQFQLGRIAREQGRLDEALVYLQAAAALDPKHSVGEVWREIGATHLAAGRLEEAAAALSQFVERRAYDPEGLYLLGDALSKLARESEAKEAFRRCVEAVETLPNYRRGLMSKWRKLARGRV